MLFKISIWCANLDLNQGPLEYQSSALPTELFALITILYHRIHIKKRCAQNTYVFLAHLKAITTDDHHGYKNQNGNEADRDKEPALLPTVGMPTKISFNFSKCTVAVSPATGVMLLFLVSTSIMLDVQELPAHL